LPLVGDTVVVDAECGPERDRSTRLWACAIAGATGGEMPAYGNDMGKRSGLPGDDEGGWYGCGNMVCVWEREDGFGFGASKFCASCSRRAEFGGRPLRLMTGGSAHASPYRPGISRVPTPRNARAAGGDVDAAHH
jgi:hypothetical protein